MIPVDFQSGIASFEEPYRYSFSWKLPESAEFEEPTHTGFVINCRVNTSSSDGNLIVSHVLFTDEVEDEYFDTVVVPGSCSSGAVIFTCTVAAFNEKGEGLQSEPITMGLPCNGDGKNWTKALEVCLLLNYKSTCTHIHVYCL